MPPDTSRTAPTPSDAASAAPDPGIPAADESHWSRLGDLDSLAGYDRLVLAVSGGPDSMALMHAVAAWSRNRTDPAYILVCTVDHRLRDGSTAEAEAVGRAAATLGLQHVIATNTQEPPMAFSQAWARDLRYGLLTGVARAGAAPDARVAVVTAHHAGDQMETILMRLQRGSGLDGLVGMRAERVLAPADVAAGLQEVMLVRPLLKTLKTTIDNALAHSGVASFDDPSNANTRFERVRLRTVLRQHVGDGALSEAIRLSAGRLGRAHAALEVMTDRLLGDRNLVDLNGYGFVRLDWARLFDEPEELRLRLLVRLQTWLSPRRVFLGQQEDRFRSATPDSVPAGNGHVVFTKPKHGITLVLPERARLANHVVQAGGPTVRFAAFDCVSHRDGIVGRLDQRGLTALKAINHPLPALPHAVWMVQPALFGHDGQLLAAPTLGFHAGRLAAVLRPVPLAGQG